MKLRQLFLAWNFLLRATLPRAVSFHFRSEMSFVNRSVHDSPMKVDRQERDLVSEADKMPQLPPMWAVTWPSYLCEDNAKEKVRQFCAFRFKISSPESRKMKRKLQREVFELFRFTTRINVMVMPQKATKLVVIAVKLQLETCGNCSNRS